MSGSFISTGVLTNNGLKLLDMKEYLDKKIKQLVIHIIPLSADKKFGFFRGISKSLKLYTPMVFNPSLTHIAIQLELENCKDFLIFEYGQYFSEESNLKNSIFSSSSKEPRKQFNENIYFYINKDGARITVFTSDYLKQFEKRSNPYSIINDLIKCQHYQISYEELKKQIQENDFFSFAND